MLSSRKLVFSESECWVFWRWGLASYAGVTLKNLLELMLGNRKINRGINIDALDLIDHIKRETGRKLQAEDFRNVRTVEDVVQAVLKVQAQDSWFWFKPAYFQTALSIGKVVWASINNINLSHLSIIYN